MAQAQTPRTPAECIDQLSWTQRSTLAAACFDGLTRRELAERAEVKPEAIKKRLQRARRRLREMGVSLPESTRRPMMRPTFSLLPSDNA